MTDTPASHNGQNAEWAARSAASPDRLMDGENPNSGLPEDARHWITVYTEMLGFKREILATMNRELDHLSPPAHREISSIDLRLTRSQQERYRGRLQYWQERLQQLQELNASDHPRTARIEASTE